MESRSESNSAIWSLIKLWWIGISCSICQKAYRDNNCINALFMKPQLSNAVWMLESLDKIKKICEFAFDYSAPKNNFISDFADCFFTLLAAAQISTQGTQSGYCWFGQEFWRQFDNDCLKDCQTIYRWIIFLEIDILYRSEVEQRSEAQTGLLCQLLYLSASPIKECR